MHCIFCKSAYPCVKNGRDRKGVQRYKCQNCKRTFTGETKEYIIASKKKRLVLHLILAGCEAIDIAVELGIAEKFIKRWKKLYLKELTEILPDQPLLAIHTLITIYKAIEKNRIAVMHIRRKNKF